MKFICFGCLDEKRWNAMSEEERNAAIDECFAYDDILRKNGHFVTGEAIADAKGAVTVRHRKGKTSVVKGPLVESKELLGGILVLEARDMEHAVQLISNHPGVRMGPFEIRPTEDISAMVEESARRRSATARKTG